MNKKKNILHITNSNTLSQYLLSIAQLYNKEKYNVIIGCFEPYGALNIELEKLGTNSFNIPVKRNFEYPLKLFKLFSILKKHKIDILHLHTFYPSFFGIIAGKMAGITKIVVTRHHADQHIHIKKKTHTFIDGWTARNCDCCIAVSEWTKAVMVKYENVKPEKINVVWNGITPLVTDEYKNKEWFNNIFNIPVNHTVFICISRMFSEKNIETAITAMAKLKSKDYPSTLLICGGGIGNHYYNKLLQHINKLEIEKEIRFLGFRNDIGDILKNSNALIHPSFGESFGFAVLEAMSQGKIVFGSNIPAMHEIATNDIAYIFNPHNSDDLVEKILFWKNNPIENTKRIKSGVERFKSNFTFEKMIRKYEELYEK